jgi:hypothetical protein
MIAYYILNVAQLSFYIFSYFLLTCHQILADITVIMNIVVTFISIISSLFVFDIHSRFYWLVLYAQFVCLGLTTITNIILKSEHCQYNISDYMNFNNTIIDITPHVLTFTVISVIYLFAIIAYKLYLYVRTTRRTIHDDYDIL